MSIFTKVAEYVVPSWVKIVLELFPYVVIFGLILGLEATRGTLDRVRDQDKIALAQEKEKSASEEKGWADAQTAATNTYTAKIQALNPVILNSIDTGKAYAQTPAGRVQCLTAARVQSILKSRNAEFASATASSSSALHAGSSHSK